MDDNNIKVINLTNIENIVLSKIEINKYLIENNIIDKDLTIDVFISKYILPNKIYISDDKSIPFGLYKYGDYIYISTTYETPEDEHLLNKLLVILKSVKYNIESLHEINIQYMIEHNDIDNIISYNNKFYIK